jgi:cytochrome c556
LTVGLIFAASTASAQDQTASAPTDAIIARKTVMNSLSDKMDDIEGAISSGKIDLAVAHADADTISVFLMAFPHLFPPATNQWKPNIARDPATDTFASPDIWIKFADFYMQSSAASRAAYNASRSQNENDLKAAIAKLRIQCNACHSDYLKQN